jgi:hypothetical protein
MAVQKQTSSLAVFPSSCVSSSSRVWIAVQSGMERLVVESLDPPMVPSVRIALTFSTMVVMN